MSNDLTQQSGSELAPVSNPLQPLAPAPDTWGNNTQLTNREINDYTQYSGGGQVVFGQKLPPGVTIAQVQTAFGQMAGVFQSDFATLGHKHSQIQAAVSWLMDAVANPPAQQRQHHRYNLFEHANDPTFQAFANFAHDHGFSAKFVQDACWWVTEAAKRLGQQVAVSQAPRMAPNSTESLLSELSEAELEQVTKINEAAKAQTYHYLEKLWGDSFTINLKMVDDYIKSLPLHEHVALDVITTGWVFALNTKEVILGLYQQAIGVHSLPSGGAVQSEIEECQHIMKVDRKRWNSDERLQARYRTLLELQSRR
ncbi:hypothetical protein [Pseudomonas sp. NPDC086251]|uniref:hypothetical protein n=1 Tax=Pseudomonas sp. NPDC086251 TaxID=3364431 RepID=UPI00383631CD